MITERNFDVAVQCHTAGDFPRAEHLYYDVLSNEPDHPDALHNLGLLASAAGRHSDALKLIDRAIALRPAAAEYHLNRGTVLEALGRTDDAIAAYREAISLRGEMAEAHNNLGNALLKSGRIDLAFASLNRASLSAWIASTRIGSSPG
jgi:Flp pilus assembly protein TadD